MCFKSSHEVFQPFASFLLSLFVCLEIFCVAPGNACAAFLLSVRAIIVRRMCYHRISLYGSSRAFVFHVAVGKASGGSSAFVAREIFSDFLQSLVSLQCQPGHSPSEPGGFHVLLLSTRILSLSVLP